MTEKVKGFTGKKFANFLRRKPKERPNDKFLSGQQQAIQRAKANIVGLFNILSVEQVDALLVEAFRLHGRLGEDFKKLGERLDKEIEKQVEIKLKRKKQAEKQWEEQKTPFYRLGLAIAYKAHKPQHDETGEKLKIEIENLDRKIKVDMLKRLKDGKIPKPLKGYNKQAIQDGVNWLVSEIATD